MATCGGASQGVVKKTLTKASLRSEVNRQVEQQRQELIKLSLKIHANPELGFEEKRASAWLTDYLAGNSFQVENGVGGLATAFKAVYGSNKPVIALFAEYDALPEIGHACGHNIIAASAVGAAVACKCVIDNCGGAVVVFGTPAEELFGGKVPMLREGVFDGVDVAMIIHPGAHNVATAEALACIGLEVEFFGKAVHAAAYPERGVNALEAMILSFNAVNSIRQHIKDRARIHGIITHGGEAANVVPAYSAAKFLVRATDDAYLGELKQKVLNCFEGAALATGARLDYRWSEIVYAPMKNNLALAQLFAQNLESLGRKVEPFEPHFGFGSTDMGNVSQVIPAIHPSVAIVSPDVLLHSADFAVAAASESGHNGLLDAAKALAMTVVDLLSEPQALAGVKDEFSG
ncbi:MAG: M20 family metallopeptidase [Chloroflexi bacterium]|nr:M20 family metallopeptidase [Chloroflexota bacterium]